MGASCLRNAIKAAPYGLKTFLRRFCFAVPGMSLNPWSRKPLNRLQYLRQKGTLSKKSIVIWHDIINNALTKHHSNNNRACRICRIDKLLSLIEQFKPRQSAIVYTARSSAPNILEQLRNSQVVPSTSGTVCFPLENGEILLLLKTFVMFIHQLTLN